MAKKNTAPAAKPGSRGRGKPPAPADTQRRQQIRRETITAEEATDIGLMDQDGSDARAVQAFEEYLENEPDDPLQGESYGTVSSDNTITPGLDLEALPKDAFGRTIQPNEHDAAAYVENAWAADDDAAEAKVLQRGEQPGQDSDRPAPLRDLDNVAEHSVDEAAQAVQQMLLEEEQAEDTADRNADEPEESDEGDAEEDSADEDDASDDEDSEADEDEADEDSEADEDKPDLHKVKVDGKEIEVTLDELRNGYQRQSAFTKKTSALAEERRTVQAERNSLATDARTMQVMLQGVANFAAEKLSPDEKAALAQMVVATQSGVQQLDSRNAADSERELKAKLEQERAKLIEGLGWQSKSEKEVDKELEQLSLGAAEEFGFSVAELAGVQDHRLLVLLNEGLAFRRGSKRAKAAKERKKVILKPGTADRRSMSGQQRSNKRLQKANEKLRRTGSPADATKAFEIMLEMQERRP